MGKQAIWKPKLSIAVIGWPRFVLGIAIGVFAAFTLSLFANYLREVIRVTYHYYTDLSIPTSETVLWYDQLSIGIALALSANWVIWVWTSRMFVPERKAQRYFRMAWMLSGLFFWMVIYFVTRLVFVLPMVLPQADRYITIHTDHYWLIVLMPLAVFGTAWVPLRMAFRSGKWMLLMLLSGILLAPVLYYTTTVDKNEVNQAYFSALAKEHQYIDEQLDRASTQYNIHYNDTTITALKEWNSEWAIDLAGSVYNSFLDSELVSLDTILLQQMLVHNFKPGKFRNKYWAYPSPYSVFYQLERHKVQDEEVYELMLLLKEMIEVLNTPIELMPDENYSETDMRKWKFKTGTYTRYPHVYFGMERVRTALVNSRKYAHLAHLLPELEPSIYPDQ